MPLFYSEMRVDVTLYLFAIARKHEQIRKVEKIINEK